MTIGKRSKDELNEMYLNIGQGNALVLGNIGGFADEYYWSSTEYNNNAVWGQWFKNGPDRYEKNLNDLIVRAVRAF